MKNIQIKVETKNKLDAFADGKPITKAMKLLLEDAPVYENKERKKKFININMDDETYDKLVRAKKYSNESHSDVIERLLANKISDD